MDLVPGVMGWMWIWYMWGWVGCGFGIFSDGVGVDLVHAGWGGCGFGTCRDGMGVDLVDNQRIDNIYMQLSRF